MTAESKHLKRVAQAAKRYVAARQDRDRAIVEASEAGISRRKVAKAAGLAWSRIQKIVTDARGGDAKR